MSTRAILIEPRVMTFSGKAMAQRIRVGTIRTTSRTFGPEEIRRLKSTAEDSPDWEEDVDRVLEQLGTVGVDDGVGIGALRRWATHPDERIQVALLSSGLTETRTWEEHEPEILGLIAYREAQGRTRGEIWTPTTDALASLIQ